MIQHAYWLPLTFHPLSLKWVDLIAELVKVRQTLCRVGDSSNIPNRILLDVKNVLCAVYAFPSIGDINEVRFLLFSCANDTTRILVASDISSSKSEMGRSDWSSVKTKLIKLYNKFGSVFVTVLVKLAIFQFFFGVDLFRKADEIRNDLNNTF
jgi:hypothetical protein